MKPVDEKSSTYIDSSAEINHKDPRFKIDDIVTISKSISKHKNSFAKAYVRNWSEEVFVIKKGKNTDPWIYVISDIKRIEIVGTFYKKGLEKNK